MYAHLTWHHTSLYVFLITIKERNGNHSAAFFTYTMGQKKGSDGGMPKVVACATKGLWVPVPDDTALAESFATFAEYFSIGLSNTASYM